MENQKLESKIRDYENTKGVCNEILIHDYEERLKKLKNTRNFELNQIQNEIAFFRLERKNQMNDEFESELKRIESSINKIQEKL